MLQIKGRLSPSLIVSVGALFVALGGTAVAAGEIITSPDQIRDKVITESKLGDGAISTRAIADRAVRLADLQQPTVAAGVNAGLVPGGEPFLINPTTDVVSVEGPPANAENEGTYTVRFKDPVRHCQWTATKAAISGAGGPPALFNVRPSQFDTHEVFVFARELISVGANQGGTEAAPTSFYLMGRC